MIADIKARKAVLKLGRAVIDLRSALQSARIALAVLSKDSPELLEIVRAMETADSGVGEEIQAFLAVFESPDPP